tara:strand:- start:245 stop:523 length:279 start_codon:yes stop_codon:yes gene_type:complete
MSSNKDFLIQNVKLNGGVQQVYKFPNGYGASVSKHKGSYGHKSGLWELAVIENINEDGFDLCYTSSVCSDVIGHLNDPQVDQLLGQIRRLGT